MPPDVRLSATARNQLTTLARRTKITHRNVLCRWGFLRSLAEESRPPAAAIPVDPAIPLIAWETFAGRDGDVLWGLLRMRCHAGGLPLDEDTLNTQFRPHLHRGLGYLAGDPRVTDIAGLLTAALELEDTATAAGTEG